MIIDNYTSMVIEDPVITCAVKLFLTENSKNYIKQNTIYFSGIVLSLENGKEVRTLKNYSNLTTTTIMKKFLVILKIWKLEKVTKKETQLKKNPRTLPGKDPFKEHPDKSFFS